MAERYFNIQLPSQPQLVELQNLLRRKLPDTATFNDPATFHVTLVYIEDDNGVGELNFDDLANDLPVFGMGGDTIDSYGDDQANNPAIGLSVDRSPQLMYLQAAIYYRAQAAGMKISQYSYPNRWKPHITMATLPLSEGQMPPYVYLPSPVMMQVNDFSLTTDGNFTPVQSWTLRTDVPVQEFEERHSPNVDNANGLDIREQSSQQDGRTVIEMTIVGEMKGGYPNIPLPSDIDVKALQDAGRKFVTLPIGQVDAKSRNDRRYTRPAVEEMVAQINKNRPEGGWGHIPDEQMATSYGPPAIRWLASQIDKNGTVWGKGLPLTKEAAQYFDDARLTNARVGTSLHAYVGMEGQDVMSMELIRLDLADPARVGVPMTAAPVQLSSEMADSTPPVPEAAPSQDPNHLSQSSEENMADNNTVAELENERKVLLKELEGLRKESRELANLKKDIDYVREMLGVQPDADLVNSVRQFREQHDDIAKENVALLGETITTLITSKVKIESVRPVVEEMVRDQKPKTKRDLERAVEQVLARESVKSLLKTGLVEEMGQPQTPPPTDNRQSDPAKATAKWLEPLPEGVH